MNKIIDLETLGKRLKQVDEMILQLIKKRMELAVEVEEYKYENQQAIHRKEIESDRIVEVEEWAKNNGLNQHFARSIEYQLINESCKVQLINLQNREEDVQIKGLIELTEKIAPQYEKIYNDSDDPDHFPIKLCRNYEKAILRELINKIKEENGAVELAVDAGCANGLMSEWLARNGCKKVCGLDISGAMINEAKNREAELENISFQQCDIEKEGLKEIDPDSVSLVMLNLGTGSDIKDFDRLKNELHRILKTGGYFFLSFYNKNALLHSSYIPWQSGLNAEIDVEKNCLNVHYGGDIYTLFAKPYSPSEIKQIMDKHSQFGALETYSFPSIASILPSIIYNEEKIKKHIEDVDKKLFDDSGDFGAYLTLTGKKIT